MEQYKEPAINRPLREFVNSNYPGMLFESSLSTEEDELEPQEIIRLAELAGIVDERDGEPLYRKLQKAAQQQVRVVVADAIDDEPYVSSQINPMLKCAPQAAGGLRLAMKATGAGKVYFAVYKNITDLVHRIPKTLEGVTVKRIRGRYPAEFRTTDDFAKEAPLALIGVCALIHLYRAVKEHRIQSSCFVTVAGNCVANPMNLEASVGMTVDQLLERCGLADDPGRIIIGGPMTGVACQDPSATVVGPATRAVLAFKEDVKERRYQCIGCGKCVDCCPENLTPFYINKYIERGRMEMLDFYEIDRCIGCGTCSYVCPAKLDVAANIKAAKAARQKNSTGGLPDAG
ncbi:MAG: SLBB domain-containing protein [Oscillospiraceae bacterium]|nr:SLBB domain-containing protein [Oscillospiraceae bacterium]